jgi:hypothetical protein
LRVGELCRVANGDGPCSFGENVLRRRVDEGDEGAVAVHAQGAILSDSRQEGTLCQRWRGRFAMFRIYDVGGDIVGSKVSIALAVVSGSIASQSSHLNPTTRQFVPCQRSQTKPLLYRVRRSLCRHDTIVSGHQDRGDEARSDVVWSKPLLDIYIATFRSLAGFLRRSSRPRVRVSSSLDSEFTKTAARRGSTSIELLEPHQGHRKRRTLQPICNSNEHCSGSLHWINIGTTTASRALESCFCTYNQSGAYT